MVYIFHWHQPGSPLNGYGAWTERGHRIDRVFGFSTPEEAEAAVRRQRS